ncbi:uncharacterized protein LOC117587061 [Drosophila guanche]|uniref:Uncharacterized protein n=2 Tax=Drosophila guanche TaxID=7266 RepID=A0A3B0JVG6_DROGU|nr:uncharacterized protein LOC117587061 [Drosophila guanche]SPP85053.1 Hypothetical predicted protein [Drosophila guanche]
MDPIVLILSYGSKTPLEIAEGILSEMDQPKTPINNEVYSHFYKCKIKTKYFNTSVNLIPFDGKWENVPTEITKETEAVIVFFDANDLNFLNTFSDTFLKDCPLKLGFLLTTSFPCEENGISLSDLKKRTSFIFDFISLRSNNESDTESTATSTADQAEDDYKEIVDGLRNVVWSNVEISTKSGSHQKKSLSSEDLDAQLNDFETLLISAQSLRSDTRLTRDEFLDKAEELAGVMSNILNDNDSD